MGNKKQNLIFLIICITSFALGFGGADTIRKQFFPNEKDKIEQLFYDNFGKVHIENSLSFSWYHPSHDKEQISFIGAVDPHEPDTKAYIINKLKFFLEEIKTQEIVPPKYKGITFWISSKGTENGNIVLSFTVGYNTLYTTDWKNINPDDLWTQFGFSIFPVVE